MNSKLKKISIILAIAGVIGLVLLSGLINNIACNRFRSSSNDEMPDGAKRINESGEQLSEIVSRVKDSINEIGNQIDQFTV